MSARTGLTNGALLVALLLLAAACIFVGSVDIPPAEVWSIVRGNGSTHTAWEVIVLQSRLPMVATAALAGAALAVAGLLLQTTFENPLAGPSILGVSSGAGLGVAIVVLALGGTVGSMMGIDVGGRLAVLAGAMVGAAAVLALLIGMAAIVRSNTMLLIVGVLVGYLASSVVSLLNSLATEEGVHNYVAWGFGTFQGVTAAQLPLYAALIAAGLLGALLLAKPLNALLLGTRYAENLGVATRRVHRRLLAVTGLLTAVVTAYCGPIGFIGLVVPHIARFALATGNHYRLLPATALCGACVALLCALLSVCGPHGVIPINAITPIIGVPIIAYIIVRRDKITYFN